MAKVKTMLSSEFSMSDLGELHSFLGIKVERIWEAHSISLSQAAYIEQVLLKYNMSKAKPCQTPMTAATKLTSESSPKTQEEQLAMADVPYRQACGPLQHLQVSTRPDINKATSVCCQFFQNPGSDHWTAVKGTTNYALCERNNKFEIGVS